MTELRNRRRGRRGGFTLMEVMLVLVILVILGSLSIGMFTRMQKDAQVKAATVQVESFKTYLSAYHFNINQYPNTSQGLQALLTPPGDLKNPQKWTGPYIEKIPEDPWGNAYQYASPGTHRQDEYDLWSNGPDGQNGTADDIGNWQ